MLLIYTVKSANILVSYKKIENIYVKSKRSFEIWICCSGQPDCDYNRVIVVAITSFRCGRDRWVV